MLNNITNKNIRATALKEFWGDEYDESIYLWHGAKNNLTLGEMESLQDTTVEDLFSTEAEINLAHGKCKELYHKFLPALGIKLNEIHGLCLPASFWGTVFGYWLFRHICIVYEKYSYLSIIDINKTSIKLLDKDSFFIPHEHFEYVYCFCNDFGVQQLVSQYYYLFKNKEFPTINKEFIESIDSKKLNLRRSLFLAKQLLLCSAKKAVSILNEPNIIILEAYYSDDIVKELALKSKGQIKRIEVPRVNISQNQISELERQKLLNIDVGNDLEHFLVHTFYYCIPRIFIEQFRNYYDTFLADIQKRDFTHIVSEGWIGKNQVAIYCAIAKNNGRKLICQEHAFGSELVRYTMQWIDRSVGDMFITTGWNAKDSKIIAGGFCKKITSYNIDRNKSNILFISHTRFPYLMEFSGHATNSAYINELKSVNDFIDYLPDNIRNKFVLRPRVGKYFWNTELAWDVDRKGIKIDTGDFAKSILMSRIVIIDHIATGLAEILMMKVPFLLILNSHVIIEKKYKSIFTELINCNVVHVSSKSAVNFLSKIYSDVQKWWKSEPVQTSVGRLSTSCLASPSKTIDYLLSCLPQ